MVGSHTLARLGHAASIAVACGLGRVSAACAIARRRALRALARIRSLASLMRPPLRLHAGSVECRPRAQSLGDARFAPWLAYARPPRSCGLLRHMTRQPHALRDREDEK